MDYYCNVPDKTIEIKRKSKNLQCITNNEIDKGIRTKYNIKNFDFFDIDEIFNDYITNRKKFRFKSI